MISAYGLNAVSAYASGGSFSAPGENEGEFLLKIHVGSNNDAQQMLSLIGELTGGDHPATTAN